jgi:hypothetical protein
MIRYADCSPVALVGKFKPEELFVQFQANWAGKTIVSTDGCECVSQFLVKVQQNSLLHVPRGPLYLYEADGRTFISPETLIEDIQLQFDKRGVQLALIASMFQKTDQNNIF